MLVFMGQGYRLGSRFVGVLGMTAARGDARLPVGPVSLGAESGLSLGAKSGG